MDIVSLKRLLIDEGVRWVIEQREAARLDGRPLTSAEVERLRPYVVGFPSLDDVRVRVVPRLADPPFFARLPDDHRTLMIDFAAMDAITFVDTIVARHATESHEATWRPTLLHELVHVAQYAILGVEGFMHEYVEGFVANDFVYRRIPLEEMAYALQDRYERGEAFSVAREVRRALA
jgi:hypothetical protein